MIPRRYGQFERPAWLGAAIDVDKQDALARFARILRDSRSPTTVRLYVGVVRRWLESGGAVDRLDPAHLRAWLARRREQRAAPATINVDLKALRAFYDTMALIGAALRGFDTLGLTAALAALACRLILKYRLTRDFDLPNPDYALLVVRDMLSFAVYVGGFWPARVRWRGEVFAVARDGTLLAMARPRADSGS